MGKEQPLQTREGEGYTGSRGRESGGCKGTNAEDVMLGEINQSQEDKSFMTLFYKLPRIVEFIETESRIVGTRS